jgi:hypothetical protein
MRAFLIALTAALGVLCFAPAPAFAWGAPGHHLIMDLAYERVSPIARAEVDRLLAAGPAHPIAACPLATRDHLATWPDCARSQNPFKGTYNEHFDDIPIFGRASKRRYCENELCATEAIKRNRRILADRRRPDGERLEALSFLVHYIGDIHQPLHAADNHDKGGNDVKVIFLGAETYPGRFGEPARFNLHGVWDTPLVGLALADGGRAAVVGMLNQRRSGANRFDPDQWAQEAHAIAVHVTYWNLPVAIQPDTPPTAPVTVDQIYVDAALPVVRQQLARATERLVLTLNLTLR